MRTFFVVIASLFFFATPLASMAGDFDSNSKIPDVSLQIPIGGQEELPLASIDDGQVVFSGIGSYVSLIFTWLIGAALVLAVLVLMWAGVQWQTAAGSQARVQAARKLMGDTVIGIGLLLGSVFLLNLINPDLTLFRGLVLERVESVKLDIYRLEDEAKGVESSKKNQLILHHSAGTDAGACLKRSGKPVCHYWVLTTGKVQKCAEENAVLACQWGANINGIGIEISSTDGLQFTKAQINATGKLVSEIVSRNNIPKTNVVSNLNTIKQKGKSGGVFNHSNICALLKSEYGSQTRWDPPENIFKMILEKAGISYTADQPRCRNPNIQGTVAP